MTFSAGALGGCAASSLAAPQAASGPRPNLIFLMTDGHRPGALSLNSHPLVRTPHLDRIGREGMQFRNAFVVNALCLPSRATYLTGLYSHTTGAIDNKERVIPGEVPLLSDLLRGAGYEVALCGKAHLGGALRDRYWDYYFGFGGAAADYMFPDVVEGFQGKIGPERTYEGFVDDVVAERALRWLRRKREKPFCLFHWFQSPHAPFFRPRRHLDLYNGIPIPKPATFDDDLKGYPGKPRAFANATNKIGTYGPQRRGRSNCARSLEELAKDYYVGIQAVDDSVGKLWQALEEMGRLDDTAVFFTADHGFFLGEWRMYDKRLMHEPSIRVPLLVRYPKMIRAGLSCDRMVLNLDLAPTILEVAGAAIPSWMQGRSLAPFLKGAPPQSWRQDWLYEYYEYPGPHNVRKNRGIRTERYKFIHYWEAPEEFELYDLREDPGELRNLYGDPRHAELAQHLRGRMQELRRETGDSFEQQPPPPGRI